TGDIRVRFVHHAPHHRPHPPGLQGGTPPASSSEARLSAVARSVRPGELSDNKLEISLRAFGLLALFHREGRTRSSPCGCSRRDVGEVSNSAAARPGGPACRRLERSPNLAVRIACWLNGNGLVAQRCSGDVQLRRPAILVAAQVKRDPL